MCQLTQLFYPTTTAAMKYCFVPILVMFMNGFTVTPHDAVMPSLYNDEIWLKSVDDSKIIAEEATLNIDISRKGSSFHHFWKSTGFCPPLPHEDAYHWMLGRDMTHNLLYIGAMPLSAIEQVRMHYMLNLVTVERLEGNNPVYNFTYLDQLLVNLWTNGLKPGFELMGNPSNFFSDFDNSTEVILWSRFIEELAKRYIGQFGLYKVSTWNFESWNEPKKKGDFSNIHMSIQGFLNYYDACSEGLRRASPRLKFGGPGGKCNKYDPHRNYCWALLKHVQSGRNFFTGRKGSRIDFISIHKKGELPNNTAAILEKEEATLSDIHDNFPGLSTVPIINDEGDPLVTWSRPLSWRTDATYAAMVIKVLVAHQKHWIENPKSKVNFTLLSNDNGFLSYQPHVFSQRTLLARFQVNTTKPHHVKFIRKPVYTILGLLGLLGDTIVKSDIVFSSSGNHDNLDAMVTVHQADKFSKQDSWQLVGVVYNSVDTNNETRISSVRLNITNFPTNQSLYWAVYLVDNQQSNPYKIWQDAGLPTTPSESLFQKMREREEPYILLKPAPFNKDMAMKTEFQVPLPGVLLFQVCAKPQVGPDQVSSLSTYNVTANQVLLVWQDGCVHAKCLKTYEVEYSESNGSPFTRINKDNILFNLFVHAPGVTGFAPSVIGFYRVRAVDFWDRPGMYSLVVPYG